MAVGKNSSMMEPALGEFGMTRIFDAPRELVFKAWEESERLVHWWGRHAFTLPLCEVDFRPGGFFRICMRSPSGRDYWVRRVYHEIVEPSESYSRMAWRTKS
jgi:uncharacterized protein YndB with AHSA1/START domain